MNNIKKLLVNCKNYFINLNKLNKIIFFLVILFMGCGLIYAATNDDNLTSDVIANGYIYNSENSIDIYPYALKEQILNYYDINKYVKTDENHKIILKSLINNRDNSQDLIGYCYNLSKCSSINIDDVNFSIGRSEFTIYMVLSYGNESILGTSAFNIVSSQNSLNILDKSSSTSSIYNRPNSSIYYVVTAKLSTTSSTVKLYINDDYVTDITYSSFNNISLFSQDLLHISLINYAQDDNQIEINNKWLMNNYGIKDYSSITGKSINLDSGYCLEGNLSEEECQSTKCYYSGNGKCDVGTIIKVKKNSNSSPYTFFVIDDNGNRMKLILNELRSPHNNVYLQETNEKFNEMLESIKDLDKKTPEQCESEYALGKIDYSKYIECISNSKSTSSTGSYSSISDIIEENKNDVNDAIKNDLSVELEIDSRTYTIKDSLTIDEAESLGCSSAKSSCPEWLIRNLRYSHNYGSKVRGVQQYNGFWTSSWKFDDNYQYVYMINYDGSIHKHKPTAEATAVKPIIYIEKTAEPTNE